jgi:glycerate 2-kinase
MAATFCENWDAPVRGLVVTRYEHGLREREQVGEIEIIEAGHPSPDNASLEAGARLLAAAAGVRADERLFCLLSGGGSALAAAPIGPLRFQAKRHAADFLLHAGADIREINCVRKHLSGLKGGRLAAAAHPHPVTTWAISDVPGDDLAAIASGPTVPDPTTQEEALAVLARHAYPRIDKLRPVLEESRYETPKPGDPGFRKDTAEIIAAASTALEAAAELLRDEGYQVMNLGDDLADEASALGRKHAALALSHWDGSRKLAILSGGETRVVLRERGGRGGRNLEYLAGLALVLRDADHLYALAADTDGIDGHGGHAGGLVTPGCLAFASRRGIDLEAQLRRNDVYTFFEACGHLLITGPTRTNVNDFRLILCEP